jgi:hypothetical protein
MNKHLSGPFRIINKIKYNKSGKKSNSYSYHRLAQEFKNGIMKQNCLNIKNQMTIFEISFERNKVF